MYCTCSVSYGGRDTNGRESSHEKVTDKQDAFISTSSTISGHNEDCWNLGKSSELYTGPASVIHFTINSAK